MPEADDEPQPQQRIGELVGQVLRIEVDHRERDQEPGERERRERGDAVTETPGDERGQNAGGELDQRIALR